MLVLNICFVADIMLPISVL